MGISEEDAQRMRAAAMEKALSGDVKGAANIAAIHDVVTGRAGKNADSGKGNKNEKK